LSYDRERRIGLAFPLRLGGDGRLLDCSYEEHVKQSIRALLLTGQGQRIMRPDFGSRLGAYLFENIDATTVSLIKSEIIDTVGLYEPRVEITDVIVLADRQNPGSLNVELTYIITRTGAVDGLALSVGR